MDEAAVDTAYALNGGDRRRPVMAVALTLMWGAGFGAAGAALLMWGLPGGGAAEARLALRILLVLALVGLMVWFAGRSDRRELLFDPRAGLLREVRHRPCRPTQELARWDFSEILSTEIRRQPGPAGLAGGAELRLRLRRELCALKVAEGGLDEMTELAARIEADLAAAQGRPRRRQRLFRGAEAEGDGAVA
ncbi:hypothetical protein SAMN04488567_1160 [Limimaricola pyoseonensis]|uniref:Uncharacterized protein n=2 Tax=Limimaricola pyoseonensis TaxID=521013 RepID=A0A1G7AY28_9RHOB|nr:hypothetical protein SAMN04488567_1160 [Limimaricola pyoseonensis]